MIMKDAISVSAAALVCVLAVADARTGGLRPGQDRNLVEGANQYKASLGVEIYRRCGAMR